MTCSRNVISLLYVAAVNLCVITSAHAGLIQWKIAAGGNDHFYDIVSTSSGMDFSNARAEASSLGGYLATPDLTGEAGFIYDNLVAPTANGMFRFYWLGAYASGRLQPFQWVTGGAVTSWGGVTYIDWAEGNVPYGIAQFANNSWTSGYALQDYTQSALTYGYVVEYPARSSVPLPATFWLFGAALAWLGVIGTRKGGKRGHYLG